MDDEYLQPRQVFRVLPTGSVQGSVQIFSHFRSLVVPALLGGRSGAWWLGT